VYKVVPWKSLIELPIMRRFAGIDLISERIPPFRVTKQQLGFQKTRLRA
jgi:hypothetical protein